jgi:hypothetical protein
MLGMTNVEFKYTEEDFENITSGKVVLNLF